MGTPSDVLSPAAAQARLADGNLRFLAHRSNAKLHEFRPELADEPQRPFAIVLGCSDSRTPVEILFDQGFGELFVVRVAGNVVAPSVVGSIEFAASQFGTQLVVVLGHTRCGAIDAAVRAVQQGEAHESRNIRSITDRISPHVQDLVELAAGRPLEELTRAAMHAHVRASADQLRHGSRLLEELVLDGRLEIVAAEYELETGRVKFLERRG